MTSIGAEVGQKMRSAIKAKLLELNCYVDDELPDYIMVMVANKRTKSQMKEDLNLFLSAKTGTFVDWLHIVLKKLKEVTVTNPDVYKKTTKRKSDIKPDIKVKKEKKGDKKVKKEQTTTNEDELLKSLTDDLPLNVNKLSEQRKITITQEKPNTQTVIEDNFDIPLLSEVRLSTEEELEDIEKKIKNVKNRLGIHVESDEEDFIKLKPEPEEIIPPIVQNKPEENVIVNNEDVVTQKPERTRIIFSNESETPPKRKSVLERLGKRKESENEDISPTKRTRIDLSNFRREKERTRRPKRDQEKPKESILSRLGVLSKVSVPDRPVEEPEEPSKTREVPSMVQIKPRIIPPKASQPNKNLLLKAVAEAQRSVAQAPKVGANTKSDALFTKKYKEKINQERKSKGTFLPQVQKDKIKKILELTEEKEILEYVPTAVSESRQPIPKYIPSSKAAETESEQQFIVTLDGLEATKIKESEEAPKVSIKSRLDKRRTPSPIIFDKIKNDMTIISDQPIVQAVSTLKIREKCKYWPNCRHGDTCEFLHPKTNCEKFPNCKFGDKCIFGHPICKFGSSCTKRDCVYTHNRNNKSVGAKTFTGPTLPQTCKFFPNCTNLNCTFFHPKQCKFGKYCKNQSECNFSHSFAPSNLTWRPK